MKKLPRLGASFISGLGIFTAVTWLRITCLFLFFCQCRQAGKAPPATYQKHQGGYYSRLYQFEDRTPIKQGALVSLNATLSNLRDSVFWSSDDHGGGQFVLRADTSDPHEIISFHLGHSSIGDSLALLIPTPVFFRQIFGSEQIPWFCAKDSAVKINIRLLGVLDSDDRVRFLIAAREREQQLIRNSFPTQQVYEKARDENGVFWLSPRTTAGSVPKSGEEIHLSYSVFFLSGRPAASGLQNMHLEYGTPDQLIAGLNYVIPYLEVGQNAKIILPSRLAFGEFGNSNGMIPPFTPLRFEVTRLAPNQENN